VLSVPSGDTSSALVPINSSPDDQKFHPQSESSTLRDQNPPPPKSGPAPPELSYSEMVFRVGDRKLPCNLSK
jgi:hypothetical protein